MRTILILLATASCYGQFLGSFRVSSLNNRYHGREYGRLGPSLPVLSGLQLWLKPDTLSTTDGQSITTWTDSSGAGHNVTCTSPCPVVARNAYFGYPAAAFTSTTGSQPAAGTPMTISSLALPLRAMTTFFVYRRQGIDANTTDLNSAQNFLSLFVDATTQLTVGLSSDDHAFFTTDQASRTGAYVISQTSVSSTVAGGYTWDGPSVIGLRSNGSELRFYGDENRTWTASVAIPPASTVTGATLGCYSHSGSAEGGWCLSGELYEALAYDRALTDTEAAEVMVYLQDRYGLRRPRATQVIFDTNSIAGGHLGQRHNIATYVEDDLRFRYNFRNESMYSYTTAQLNSAAPAVVHQYCDPAQRNIVVFSEGLNSLETGVDTTTVYNQMVSGCNAYRTAGCEPVYNTLTARSVSGQYTDAKRQTVNTAMRNNLAAACPGVVVCDPGGDSIIGNAANVTNPEFFQDGAHLADGGARRYSNYVTACLRGKGL